MAANFRNSAAWKRARRVVLNEQDNCGICKKPVDKTLPPRTPQSPEVDHIIPIEKGGHPTMLENLMLTHKLCNQVKGIKILGVGEKKALEKQLGKDRYYGSPHDWSSILGRNDEDE